MTWRYLAVVLGAGCAHPNETAPAATGPPGDQAAQICPAVAGPGPIEVRLASAFPLHLGGVLYLFGGTQAGAVFRALEPLGLQGAQVVGCRADEVVVFIQGVDRDAAPQVEARIVAGAGAGTRTTERAVISPRTGPSPQRPGRD